MPHSEIKIIISYHTLRCPRIASDILVPVQTGSALADHLFQGMQHDNEGENISAQNPKYNELSALYWAWKNQDKLGHPDFIGLMHDRRHFLFNENIPIPNKDITWLPKSSVYMFPPLCEQYMSYVTDEVIQSYFPAYDCMVLEQYDGLHLIRQGKMRDYFLYSPEMTTEIFDIWTDTVRKLFPDYIAELEQFINGTKYYLCNMFVMRKDLFEQYCSFLFTILQAVDKRIDSTSFSVEKKRFLGYLGEFTLSLFVMKLYARGDIRIKEMKGNFFLSAHKKYYDKIIRYWFKKNFTCGNLRKQYQQTYNEVKAKQKILKFFK